MTGEDFLERLLLMLPGPMQIPDAVAEAARKPLFFHRSPRFMEFQDALRSRIRPLFGTDSAEIVFLTACGTGASTATWWPASTNVRARPAQHRSAPPVCCGG